MNALIKKVVAKTDLQHCFAIRLKVFVEEQSVPMHEEMDGKDKDSTHYLLSIAEKPVGVARVRFMDDVAKIERMAILSEYQGKGLGKQMMNYILSDLQRVPSINIAKLSAQTHALAFYEKLGFVVCSPEYMDANIPHKDMKLILKK